MKQLLLFALFSLPFFTIAQIDRKGQFGFFATTEIPFRSEMPRMSTNLGFGTQFAYKPISRVPVFLELKANVGVYNTQNRDVTYVFTDGSTTDTDIEFKSKMHKLQFGTKVYYTNYYRPVRGYFTPQIGYNFMKTRMRIADPMDEDDCQPLENSIRHRSAGWTYGAEAGIELDMNRIIHGKDVSDQRLYISASFMGSMRPMDYINVKYMEEHVHGPAGEHDHDLLDADGRPLNAEFINLTSGTTHEHKIAEIYNTHLRFFSINVGYVWYL